MSVPYSKTKVDSVVSVLSVITVYHIDLSGRALSGEAHDFPEIFYVESGRGRTRVEGSELLLNAGQMVIYAPNAFHGTETPSLCPDGTVDIVSFETERPLPSSLYNRPITLSGQQRLQIEQIIQTALPLFEKRIGVRGMLRKNGADPCLLQRVKNLLELFLLSLITPSESYSMRQMAAVTDYMMQNIGRTLTLQDITRDLGVSLPTLKQLVRENCASSPIAYFSELKIEEAKRLIRETPMNMTEISQKLGFLSVHHFSKKFKQKTGLSPTEYARTHKI